MERERRLHILHLVARAPDEFVEWLHSFGIAVERFRQVSDEDWRERALPVEQQVDQLPLVRRQFVEPA
jgi:hypothetical protein